MAEPTDTPDGVQHAILCDSDPMVRFVCAVCAQTALGPQQYCEKTTYDSAKPINHVALTFQNCHCAASIQCPTSLVQNLLDFRSTFRQAHLHALIRGQPNEVCSPQRLLAVFQDLRRRPSTATVMVRSIANPTPIHHRTGRLRWYSRRRLMGYLLDTASERCFCAMLALGFPSWCLCSHIRRLSKHSPIAPSAAPS